MCTCQWFDGVDIILIMASRKSPLFDTATTVGKIMSFLGIAALCGLLSAGLIFPLAATGGAAASAGSQLLDEVPAELDEEALSTPSHMYANDGETLIATFYAENRIPVEYDEISQHMLDAIIAIEDERFYEHGGVDAQGVARAAVNNFTSEGQQGASTLTMQYVNNVLNNAITVRGDGNILAAGIQEKTYADKLREMKLAVQVEQEMTKDEILVAYLNIVMLGGVNYGVEAAAQYYWGVSAAELNIQQAATLAGIVQAPNSYRPDLAPELAESRRNTVLYNMYDQGFITEAEYEDAREADLAESLLPAEEMDNERGCIAARESFQYFCDYAQRDFLMSEAFGETEDDRGELLARGGLRIVTTIDPAVQEVAYDEVWSHRPQGQGAAASLLTTDPRTGEILAMAQSTDYALPGEDDDGPWDETSLNINVAESHNGGSGFESGSALKPFVSAAWIEEGGSMDDRVDASETEYDSGDWWEASCVDGGRIRLGADDEEDGVWRIFNVNDSHNREMTVDWGLMRSINTATVAMAYDMDLCAITDVTDRLGIRAWVGPGQTEGLDPRNPSFVMGSANIAPIVMNHAYAAFANDGTTCEPRSILSVTDASGNEYDVPESDCEELVDPDVIAQVNDSMINIAEQSLYVSQVDGSAPFPMAGKTGTHQSAAAMSFQGYTEGLMTSAYVARVDDNHSMWPDGVVSDRPGHGNLNEDQYAGDVAFPLWYDYMREVAPSFDTGDFREADDSPFDERRSGYGGRYSESELGSGGGSSNNSDDDDDDDD